MDGQLIEYTVENSEPPYLNAARLANVIQSPRTQVACFEASQERLGHAPIQAERTVVAGAGISEAESCGVVGAGGSGLLH